MVTNIYAPFSLPIHLAICIVATLFYGYMFMTKKHSHYFTIILAFDITLLTQMNISKIAFYSVTVTEMFLIALIITSLIRIKVKNKKSIKDEVTDEKIDIVDNAFNNEDVK